MQLFHPEHDPKIWNMYFMYAHAAMIAFLQLILYHRSIHQHARVRRSSERPGPACLTYLERIFRGMGIHE